jgi:hypothetical protein
MEEMKSKQHHRKVIKANKYISKWKHESIKKRFNHHRIIIQKERDDDEGERREKEVKT